MGHLLPRYYRRTQDREAAAAVDKAVRESINPDTAPKATLPGDTRRLRGIPVAGGACGTSPGTDPLHAVLRRNVR